jgi:hypothetical protein
VGLLVRALGLHTPGCLRAWALGRLAAATAEAFGAPAPPLDGLGPEARLGAYARFTRAEADAWLAAGRDAEGLAGRLYRSAAALGGQCREWLGPRGTGEVLDAARLLYRLLDIDLRGDAGGGVTIARCYFSRYYSAEVCRVMSAMDRGLLAGLSGGGVLTFSARITEGAPCCRAHLGPGDVGG